MRLRFGLAAPVALGLACASSIASAESGLAGTYRASPQRIEAQVSAWGVDCGVRPKSQVLDEQGQVEVREQGAHLLLKFPDRSWRTDRCWSPNPAVKLLSATAVDNRFRAECRTSAGDAKREIGRYTVIASPGKLELVEESEYDWQLNQSHCLAKVRVTQTLVDASSPAPPTPPAEAPVAEAPAPAPANTPCTPGAAARIRMRPSEARIAPGERVCFTIRAVDALGCASEIAADALSLTLTKPSGAQGSLNGTCFKAAPNAAQAEGVFKVVANAGNLRAETSVSVSALDLSDITARRGPSSGGALETSAQGAETPLESGIRAVASSSHGMLWLGLSIAGAAGILSLIAIVALRVLRRKALSASDMPPRPSRAQPAQPAATTAAPLGAPTAAASSPRVEAGPQRVCPQCRRGYAPGTERCSTDGAALLDYNEFMKQAHGGDEGPARVCPKCGEQLSAGSMFCGLCGHRL